MPQCATSTPHRSRRDCRRSRGRSVRRPTAACAPLPLPTPPYRHTPPCFSPPHPPSPPNRRTPSSPKPSPAQPSPAHLHPPHPPLGVAARGVPERRVPQTERSRSPPDMARGVSSDATGGGAKLVLSESPSPAKALAVAASAAKLPEGWAALCLAREDAVERLTNLALRLQARAARAMQTPPRVALPLPPPECRPLPTPSLTTTSPLPTAPLPHSPPLTPTHSHSTPLPSSAAPELHSLRWRRDPALGARPCRRRARCAAPRHARAG